MPYREHAEAIEARGDRGGPLAQLDVSGRRGTEAAHGAPGRDGSDGGGNGRRGGDAPPAEPGQHAGVVEITLQEPADAPGLLRLRGKRLDADGTLSEVDDVVPVGTEGFVELTARGGRGGTGGDGGRGGDGGTGTRGSDATRYRNGTNGGPGGDGGDGGRGSDGAAGGRGGEVKVRVAERDMHLLMLLAADVRGGEGGIAGQNGDGGSGGSGGAGGSSYSWTESESYTDSSGNRQTRTTHHRNPGGSTGVSGSSGRPATEPRYQGEDGAHGRLTIDIGDGAHAGQYGGRYDLRLTAFEHRCDNRDGVYEPEETVHVSRITVQNVGVMPTPAQHDIELRLHNRGWVVPEEQHLVLPRSLPPGASHVFAEELRFRIGVFRPTRSDDPLAAAEDILHRASMPAVRRDFGAYQDAGTAAAARLLIRFPVQVTAIETLYSLAPDQAARIRWTVTNVSSRAFGAGSDLGRAVRTRLALWESEIGADELLFFDETGARVSLDRGFEHTLPVIGPGESCEIAGIVAVAPSTAHYRAGKVGMALELGAITAPKEARPIQLRDFAVRVGMPYQSDADASVLLLSNNRSTEREIAAWRALVESLGGRAAVWDLSLEGGVDLEQRSDGPSLSEQFAGKTLVVLNNEIDGVGARRRASSSVAKAQLLGAAATGTRVLFVGGSPELATLAVHGAAEPATSALAAGELCDALAERRPDPLALPGGAIELQVPVKCWWPWSTAGEDSVRRVAARLCKRLRAAEPQHRYVVSYAFEPELDKQFAWFRTYRGGTVTVRRELDGQVPGVLAAEVADEALHDAERVLGIASTTALALATPFAAKLGAFAAVLALPGAAADLERPALPAAQRAAADVDADADVPPASDAASAPRPLARDETGEVLLSTLLADLACEQLSLLRSGWGAPDASIASCLPLLDELATTRLPLPAAAPEAETAAAADADTAEAAAPGLLVRLVATLRFFIDAQTRGWEHLPPFTFWRTAPRVRRVVHAAIDRFVAGLGDETARAAFTVAVKAERKRLRARARQAVREADAADDRAFARDLLLAPFDAAGVKTDLDVLGDGDRVRARDEEEKAAAKDGKRDARRTEMARSAAAARSALLEVRSTTELLAGAARFAPAAAVAGVRIAAESAPPAGDAEAESLELEGLREDMLDAFGGAPRAAERRDPG